MPNMPSRRQRRFAKRQGEILDVAARIFAEKGYGDTKVTEIAAALDIADGTLYNYFDSKRDILLAIMDKTRSDIEPMLQEIGELETRDDLVAVLARTYDVFMAQLPFTRTMLMEAWADDTILQAYAVVCLEHIRQRMHEFIVSRVDTGDFRPIDPSPTTQMVLGMFFAPVVPILRGITPPLSPEQCRALAEAAVDLLLDGIRVRPERGAE
ncbi:MAG: TetR/AcrR family transcriptional regulator [Chloroflexi bacterium]|nr:TetR/AcrR family transcriptional regulator [Chloroflexota bacterium]MBU1748508.1 TetR/AcrR family transcriptional regulator [Chloroflexota bacterium]